MQIFIRCGGPVGTVALDCLPQRTIGELKEQVAQRCKRLGRPDQFLLIYGKQQLQDEMPLSNYDVLPWSTFQLSSRLRGGGGDGGSTGAESRSCYLEMYLGKKPDKVNPAEEQLAKYTRCHLSGELLSSPCVVDELGNLFNKEAIVNGLLHKSLPSSFAHISSLKHVVELKLHHNPNHSSKAPADSRSYQPSNDARYCCPVTGSEFNGRFKFVVHRKNGHVVSEKAIKEVPAVVEELFGGKWVQDDLIPVNPSEEQLEQLIAKVLERLAAERDKKLQKKKSKAAAALGADAGDNMGPASNGDAACSSQPVDASDAKARKRSSSSELPASASAVAGAPPAAAAGAMLPPSKKAKAMQHMPSGATPQVYASLFTSSVTQPEKESYLCRSTSARGMHLT